MAQEFPDPSEVDGHWTLESAEQMDHLVKEAMSKHGITGVSIGIIRGSYPDGQRTFSYGIADKVSGRMVDDRTIFEIGSMSKSLTSLALVDLFKAYRLDLNSPIEPYLPPGIHAPSCKGRSVTFFDLATHTSGLPRDPVAFKPDDQQNPYKEVSPSYLFWFLNRWALLYDHPSCAPPGTEVSYSNLGFSLLGQLLTDVAKTDFDHLLKARVSTPLGMTDTMVGLSTAQQARVALGYDHATGHVMPAGELPYGTAASGGIRSTTKDLLRYLAANMQLLNSSLAGPIAVTLAQQRGTADTHIDEGFGWQIETFSDSRVFWKNGAVGGFASFMGFDPQAKTGVVILTNTSIDDHNTVDKLGMKILAGIRKPALGSATGEN